MSLAIEIRSVLNKFSVENESDTPDWILADYLLKCLDAFNHATVERDLFYRDRSQDKEDGA